MRKIVTIYSFMSLIFIAQPALALSFGKIDVYSKYAEPFNAEIAIPTYKIEELKDLRVGLASQEEFAKRGIARPEILQNFSFQVIQKDGSHTINIAGNEPIKELSFELLVAVSWPTGSVIKSYNILLTPNAISENRQQSVIALALKENSQLTITDALLSLVAKKLDGASVQLLSLDSIRNNLFNEWNALTNHPSAKNNLPILQANSQAIQITQEEIESKKLELESVREFAAELDAQNNTLREQVLALEEDLLLSTKSIFGDSAEVKLNEDTTTAMSSVDIEESPVPLESFASLQKQKEMLIGALIFLIIALVAYKKKDFLKHKLQVRRNQKADAEARF